MPVDPLSFRKALGNFASGVTVVTTLAPDTGARLGVTVSAFCSLSLDPPLVLFCLGNRTTHLDAFRTCGRFAVNVLASDQADLSNRFAGKAEDKFAGIDTGESGVPLLPGCVATLDCTLVDVRDGGDHVILVGQVERSAVDETKQPLLYCRGKYGTLAEG